MYCIFVNKWYCSSSRTWNLGISFLSLVRLAADTALEFPQALYTENHTGLQYLEDPQGC